MVNKEIIITRLMELPGEIYIAENNLIAINEQINMAKNMLSYKEAELLTGGQIDGKNAEQRAAQLKQMTEYQRQEVGNTESLLPVAKAVLNRLLNEFSALKAVAGMMREVV